LGGALAYKDFSSLSPAARPDVSGISAEGLAVTLNLISPDDGKLEERPFARAALPKVISSMLSENDLVMKAFFGKGGGLINWVIHDKYDVSRVGLVYTSMDGTTLWPGSGPFRVDDSGEVVDAGREEAARYRKPIDFPALWPELEHGAWIRDGEQDDTKAGSRVIYGFFDANCIYCHLSWLALKPYMEKGLQVRWLPVNLIGETSTEKGAALLLSDHPGKSMAEGHQAWATSGSGATAFPVAAEVPPKILTKLQNNSDLMRRLGGTGTPLFVYRDRHGGIRTMPGFSKLHEVAEMAGMSYIENSDPRLARFR